MFRAPIVSWIDDDVMRNRRKLSKYYIVNPKVQVIRKHFAPEVIFALDDKIERVEIVEDKDTDSTPLSHRSNFRRIARKKLIYANIYFYDKTMSESEMFSSVENLMESITFCSDDAEMDEKVVDSENIPPPPKYNGNGCGGKKRRLNFSFKLFTDDLACQDFLLL
jgi:hypothetical protein